MCVCQNKRERERENLLIYFEAFRLIEQHSLCNWNLQVEIFKKLIYKLERSHKAHRKTGILKKILSMGVQAVLVVVLLGVATTKAREGNSLAFVLIHILKSLSLSKLLWI